jgi:putative transposase
MARGLRDERPGYHHISTRGNNKQTIFLNDGDRGSFLALLELVAVRHHWRILTFCLMRNHYHLVLRVSDGLAQGMRELNGVYAKYFNGEHGRINHLFGCRYWSEFTETEAHLKNAVRYVVQNPRRAGAKGPLESHPWTSYGASIGNDFGLQAFARDELLALFGTAPASAVAAFTSFCEEPAPPRDERCLAPARKARVRLT